jgi:hypothetical protein
MDQTLWSQSQPNSNRSVALATSLRFSTWLATANLALYGLVNPESIANLS